MEDKNSLRRASFLLITLVMVYIGIGFLYAYAEREVSGSNYATFQAKKRHADKSIGGQRVLLLGGSNVIWGYKSRKLEEELQIPTTNMALLAESGLPSALRQVALTAVKNGDIVVYSSIGFYDAVTRDETAGHKLLLAAGIKVDEISLEEKKDAFPTWLPLPKRDTLAFAFNKLYWRYVATEDFFSIHNEYGDIKQCVKTKPVEPQSFRALTDKTRLIDKLKTFQQKIRDNGGELVVEFPPVLINEGERGAWIESYQPFFDQIKKEFNLANQDLSEVFSSDEPRFCDSPYHFGDEEALQRTKRMAHYLKSKADLVPGRAKQSL